MGLGVVEGWMGGGVISVLLRSSCNEDVTHKKVKNKIVNILFKK